MMVERNDGVRAIATKARHPWFYWITGEIEWIECVVEKGATMRLHCDASSQLKFTMRVFQPDTLDFKLSRETEYILHFQHDDDTYVYKYSIDVHAVRYVTERQCPSEFPTDYKQLFFRSQLKQGNSVHDGIEIVHLGSHILSVESPEWDTFVPPKTKSEEEVEEPVLHTYCETMEVHDPEDEEVVRSVPYIRTDDETEALPVPQIPTDVD